MMHLDLRLGVQTECAQAPQINFRSTVQQHPADSSDDFSGGNDFKVLHAEIGPRGGRIQKVPEHWDLAVMLLGALA